MKLGMCSLHERMPVEFPCLAIRHDDGRKATPREVWEWAMSLDRKAREECAEICARISKSYENTGYEWMTGVHSAKRCEQAIRETIK